MPTKKSLFSRKKEVAPEKPLPTYPYIREEDGCLVIVHNPGAETNIPAKSFCFGIGYSRIDKYTISFEKLHALMLLHGEKVS